MTFPQGLEPALLWKNFSLLTSTPRCSGAEAAVIAKIADWADKLGLERHSDEAGNLLVRVPASPGFEGRASTVLQGHVDMVCEKNADSKHNFETCGLTVVRDGDWLRAVGTTLGADNGIGVAAGMAIAEDSSAQHGPLELLFTVDEETGMTGAWGLQAGFLRSKRLLNLDTEEEHAIYVGCSGGGDVMTRFMLDQAAVSGVAYRLSVRGLVGGHSGLNIHEHRGNAIKLLARTLAALENDGISYQITEIEGGSKRNAIPREASALILLPSDAISKVETVLSQVTAQLVAEFHGSDPQLTLQLAPAAPPSAAASAAVSRKLTALLLANPSGVEVMSRAVPGLVETSNNLGVIRMTDGAVELVNCTRSSLGSALEASRASLRALHLLAGADVELNDAYPGWQPDLSSTTLAVAQAVHERMFGHSAEIKAVHAGLECGLLGQHYPGLDMISIGPDILGAHSPDERVSVPSTARFYDYLKVLLQTLD